MSLFPDYDASPDYPAWFKGGTDTQKRNVLKRLHPLGFELNKDETKTCGGCEHAATRHLAKTYKKCKLRHTGGPATDIRWKWRACVQWEPEKDRG